MASLKEQLDAAGYDTSSLDEASIIKQLDAAGYDTSQFAPAPKAPESKLDKAANFSRKVTDLLSKPLEPIGQAVGGIANASNEMADKLAESGHPFLAMHAAGPAILAEGVAKPFEWLDKAGEYVAEKGAEKGMNPYVSAGLGTVTQMLPDIAMGAEGIAKRALIAKSLKGGAEAVGKTIKAPVKAAKELAFAPRAEEVAAAGKDKLVKISERQADKLGLAREAEQAAKEGLIGAEEKAGLHFQSTPEFESYLANPKKMADFSQKASRLAKLGPEQLAQQVEPQVLQTFRKIAQEGEKVSGLSDIAKAQMREAKDIFTQALGKTNPEIGTELSRFREAQKVVKEIPGETKERLLTQKRATEKDVLGAKKTERTRKLIKAALKGGLAYTVAKSFFK